MSTLRFTKLYADSAYWQVIDSSPGCGHIGNVMVHTNIRNGSDARASFEAQPFARISKKKMVTILEFMETMENEYDTNN